MIHVDANGSLTVSSTVNDERDLTASASIDGSAGGTSPTVEIKAKQSKNSVALGIALGIYENQADAIIAGNANVDAKNAITVKADAVDRLDPASTYGANLAAPFRDFGPTYTTDSDSPVLSEGDTVEVLDGYTGGDERIGLTYRYKGPDGAAIDLKTEDYSDPLKWEEANLGSEAGMAFFRTLTTYLDGNLGLDYNLPDFWTQATATGSSEKAVAGAITVVVLKHTANAKIESHAKINQDRDFGADTDNQTVVVEATSDDDTVNLSGNFKTLSAESFGLGLGVDSRTWSFDKGAIKQFRPLTGVGDDSKSAVGVSVAVYNLSANVNAIIEDGVQLYADSLEVDAESETMAVDVGASGGKAKNLGVNGVATFTFVDNTTIAQIGEGATITVGDNHVIEADGTNRQVSTLVEATDTSFVMTLSGSLAIAERTGIGGSFAINGVSRTTEALIGNRDHDHDATELVVSGGSFKSGGGVSILAHDDGFVGSFAIAGAKAANKKQDARAKFGLAVGVAAAFAESQGFPSATVGVGGGVAINEIDRRIRAAIEDTIVTVQSVNVDAESTPNVNALGLGIAGSLAKGTGTTVAVALVRAPSDSPQLTTRLGVAMRESCVP